MLYQNVNDQSIANQNLTSSFICCGVFAECCYDKSEYLKVHINRVQFIFLFMVYPSRSGPGWNLYVLAKNVGEAASLLLKGTSTNYVNKHPAISCGWAW